MKALIVALLLLAGPLGVFAQAPTWPWAQQSSIVYQDIATDRSGLVYATGSFSGTVQVGAATLTSRGSTDLFIGQFTPGGQLLWSAQVSGSGAQAYGTSIAVDALGNCYVTGRFRGTLTQNTGGSTLTAGPWAQILVLKCGPGGAVQWARQGGGDGYANDARAIAVDRQGNCVITGALSGTAVRFDHLSFAFPLRQQLFVARYSATGTVQWVTPTQSAFFTAGNGIGLDDQGNCYVTGTSFGHMLVDGIQYPATGSSGTAPTDVVVAKFGAARGEAQWVHLVGSPTGNDTGTDLAVDGAGNCYVTGYFTQAATFGRQSLPGGSAPYVFVAHYSADGTARWARQLHETTAGTGSKLALTPGAGLAVLSTEASPAQTRLTGLNHDGSSTWQTVVSGAGTSNGRSLAASANGSMHLSGLFTGPCQFGRHALASAAETGFLARLHFAPRRGYDQRRALAEPLARTATSSSHAVAVYPNPAHEGRCTLEVPGASAAQPAQLTVLNHYGAVVRTQALTAEASVCDVAGLLPGPYTLRVVTPDRVVVTRSLLVAP